MPACEPTCDLPPSFTTEETAAICPVCDSLWEIREVTEVDCESIDGQPIPGTWRRRETIRAWCHVPTRAEMDEYDRRWREGHS
jgi:hypothetical protein